MTDEQLKKMQVESIERRLAGVKSAMKEVFHPPIKTDAPKPIKKDVKPDMEIISRLQKLYFEGVERSNKVKLDRKQKKKTPQKIDFQKIIAANKIVEKPSTPRKWCADPPVHPDEIKEFTRPPAIYTNTPSPYGIADELHSK